jgi:sialidase-1
MVPKEYRRELHSHKPSVISTLYSKDQGKTWKLGEILSSTSQVISPNETTAAETSDGRVYLNIRHMIGCRAKAYSKNGFSHWEEYGKDEALSDPCCFGSTASYGHNGRKALIFANCNSESERKNVTVRVSLDDGNSWAYAKCISADLGGYVETVVDNQTGYIYVLFETDWGKTCRLVVTDLDSLLSEEALTV